MDRKRLEAPPGFEPGMEVLQTSALPLGDGAGWNYLLVQESPAASQAQGQQRAQQPVRCVISVRRLERETGFEPATSTLARSHSTTELFPLASRSANIGMYHTARRTGKATGRIRGFKPGPAPVARPAATLA